MEGQARSRALDLARDCAALGARIGTIASITGLNEREISRLVYWEESSPRGRKPASSSNWYYTANMIDKAEASIFMGIYQRIRDLRIDPAQALVTGFREYMHCVGRPRVGFDRAFVIVCRTEGIWSTDRELAMKDCTRCDKSYLVALGDDVLPCPFCHLIKRQRYDRRVQAWFALRRMPVATSDNAALAKRLVVPRSGTRSISGYFPASTWETLRLLAERSEKSRQELFGEALMRLFGKHWGLLQKSGCQDAHDPHTGLPGPERPLRKYNRCPADRRGKRIIAGHYQPSMCDALRVLARALGRTNQSLLEEALADLFANYPHLLGVKHATESSPRLGRRASVG